MRKPGDVTREKITMKTLILLRHAKSDWNVEYGRDHDRPLNRRGHRSAEVIGRFLTAIEEVPEAIVTSTAVRARTTVEEAAVAGGWGCGIETSSELYEASSAGVLDRIRRCDDHFQRLLVAGHEPTWSTLGGELIGRASIRMVTAAMVRIDFGSTRWCDLEPGSGELIWMLPPRMLEKLLSG